MKQYGFLQAEYDRLIDLFSRGGELDIIDARTGLKRNLKGFLESGCKVNQIMSMLSAEDIFAKYDVLTAYGAEIDVMLLAKGLGDVFVMEHLEWFDRPDVDANRLFDAVFNEYSFYPFEDLDSYFGADFNKAPLRFIKFGVDIEKVFDTFQWWLEFRYEWEDDLREGLTFFVNHGLPRERVKKWLNTRGLTKALIWGVVVDHSAEWANLGVDREDHLEEFLDAYAGKYLEDDLELPEGITEEDVLRDFSVREIDFYVLIERGWNPEILAKKLIDEQGYRDSTDELSYIVYAEAENGHDASRYIDIKELVRCILAREDLSADEKKRYIDDFTDAGYGG